MIIFHQRFHLPSKERRQACQPQVDLNLTQNKKYTDESVFLRENACDMNGMTCDVMMIRPKHFGFNEETAQNNAFQNKDNRSLDEIQKQAVHEFDQLVQLLRNNGVRVNAMEDSDTPVKPDAVFPNNWVSFHFPNIGITYPMKAESRRFERREEVIEMLSKSYDVSHRYHFEQYEEENQFLEGTGSMVLDRRHKVCYACLSPRTDIRLLDKFCLLMGYKLISFHARDRNGMDIYHTNVMMAWGHGYVVACLHCISNEVEKEAFVQSIEENNQKLIPISFEQMNDFAGNMLQLKKEDDTPLLVMSTRAYKSLTESQLALLNEYTEILHSPISTIEFYGGGSVRCMIAELFLDRKHYMV